MSVKVSALCWQIPLPIADKLVLLRLADYADDHGGNIYPSVATIAHFCGISERAVQYILKRLTTDGLIFVLGNEGGGRGKARTYCIDLDRAGQMAGPGGGQKNGTGKRAQRVQRDCTLSDTPQTPQRVQTDAEKGAVDLHPIRHRSVIEEEPVCSVDVDPREAPPLPANVVPIKPTSGPAVSAMPDDWTLPAEWRAWAMAAGWDDPDGSAERFANHWLGKKDRGDRDAANSEAGWLRQWTGWINGDIKRGKRHGEANGSKHDRLINGFARAFGDLVDAGPADTGGDCRELAVGYH